MASAEQPPAMDAPQEAPTPEAASSVEVFTEFSTAIEGRRNYVLGVKVNGGSLSETERPNADIAMRVVADALFKELGPDYFRGRLGLPVKDKA